MRRLLLAAVGAATIAFATPAAAQDIPLEPGNYWEVAAITIDDGHFATYADHLAGNWRKSQEFAKSKGYIKSYHVLSNNNRRKDEPDLYLITVFDKQPTAAEQVAREKEFNAFMARTSRQMDSESGERAKYRKLSGSMLLQELVFKK